MKSMWRLVPVLVAGTLVMCTATPIQAQQAARPLQQVVSANPFGLLIGLFNAEYERRVSESTTAGLGGSSFSSTGDDYVNADLFFRYYPSGKPFEGWAFGVKAGVTKVTDQGTFFGCGSSG